MRTEFESKVIHKQLLNRVRFSEKSNQYHPVDADSEIDRACCDTVNVSYIAYQYQQKKVDELQKEVAELKKFRVRCVIQTASNIMLKNRIEAVKKVITEYYTGSYDESPELIVDIQEAIEGEPNGS